jgi:predicted transcriptional regulator
MTKARTKDEKFMLAIYEEALKMESMETPFSRYDIGQKIGLHPRGVDTICTLLLQANFLKKENKEDVFITEHGIRLVETLLSDK